MNYTNTLASDLQRRTVPSGATGLASTETDERPCAIGRRWRFSTEWNRESYVRWLKVQLLPEYVLVRDAPDELTFSRHDDGDTRTLVVEGQASRDILQVQVSLCVYPD